MSDIKIFKEYVPKNGAPTFTCIELIDYIEFDNWDFIRYKYKPVSLHVHKISESKS